MPGATKQPAGGRIRELPRELVERGRELAGAGREVWLAGLGVFALAGDEGGELFARLVKAGETLEKRGRAELDDRHEELESALEEHVYDPVLSAVRGVTPAREEIEELKERVEQLIHRVEALVNRLTRSEAPDARTIRVYRVISDAQGWAVELDGDNETMAVFPTKDQALERARKVARDDLPSRLEVYRKDGTLQDTLEF